MANIAENIFAFIALVMVKNISICESNSLTHLQRHRNEARMLYDPITQLPREVGILVQLNATLGKLVEMVETLKPLTQLVNHTCPPRYERVANCCFYVRGPYDDDHRGSPYREGSVDWDTARLYCQAIDGDLAVVDDLPRFLAYYRRKPKTSPSDVPIPYYNYWYGARRVGEEILYLNGTALPANSSHWDILNPGPDNCVSLHTTKQKLITADCTNEYYFICKANL